MNNIIKFSTVVIFYVCLLGCKEQRQASQELVESPDTKIDTIYTENAPSRIVRRIRKNRAGNLLIAAFTDVILYDGKAFSKFPKPEGFESFDAFDAFEDSKGDIWIASTHFGVFRYAGKDYTHFTTENGLAHNRTIDVNEDRAGNIWISTMGGISRYDGNSFRNFTTKDGLTDNDVNRIMEDKTGKLWIGTRGKACIFDGNKFTTITREDGQPFTNVRDIIEDKDGHIWLGGGCGLWEYDGKIFKNHAQIFIGNIHEDLRGNIWALSDRFTFAKYEKIESQSGKRAATELSTSYPMLFGLSDDTEGNIWIGTGNSILRYDGKALSQYINR